MCLKAEFDELQYEYVRLKMQTEQEILSLNLQVQVLQKVRPVHVRELNNTIIWFSVILFIESLC